MPRIKIADSTQSEVLVQSRRRCCICFGIKRDEAVKKGQIAHLDGNPNNNETDNLAFLCLEHHDEYDGATSQSKGLTVGEVKKYRAELYSHFGSWLNHKSRENLLNFLAFTVDLNVMADAAIKAAGQFVFYQEMLAHEVLTHNSFKSCDGDLYLPYLGVLDYFSLWGWLKFVAEEREENGLKTVFIKIEREPICDELAKIVHTKIPNYKSQNDQKNVKDS